MFSHLVHPQSGTHLQSIIFSATERLLGNIKPVRLFRGKGALRGSLYQAIIPRSLMRRCSTQRKPHGAATWQGAEPTSTFSQASRPASIAVLRSSIAATPVEKY